MCPGHNESAGKRRSGKTRHGNQYLRASLVQAGLAAMRKNRSALQAQYHRIKRYAGHKKAVVAVGHQILEIAFYVMRAASPTARWEPTTSIAGIPNGPSVDTFGNSKRSDSAWRSRRRPNPETDDDDTAPGRGDLF
ncbi:MAG: transposase [Vicinamibacteraceae bacterium]